MKSKPPISRRLRKVFLALSALLTVHCSTNQSAHNGTLPFSLMEKAPSLQSALRKAPQHTHFRLTKLHTHNPDNSSAKNSQIIRDINAGDIIAFHMPHSEARKNLLKGRIQKVPYELFRHGHLALISPSPDGLKLLQVAMKQSCNTDSDLSYLNDKHWTIYRLPSGSFSPAKLSEFTQIITAPGSNHRYDYPATLGITNGNITPITSDEIKANYTCCTLVIAALHYAGCHIHATHRNGKLDLITPAQVTSSWAHSTHK